MARKYFPINRCPICVRRKVDVANEWCSRCVQAVRDQWSLELHRLETEANRAEYPDRHFSGS